MSISLGNINPEMMMSDPKGFGNQLVTMGKTVGVNDPKFLDELQKAGDNLPTIGVKDEAFKPINIGITNSAPKFGDMLAKGLKMVHDKERLYHNELGKVLRGESDNIHRAMIASKESETYFKIGKMVQTKLVEAWQELMKTQV